MSLIRECHFSCVMRMMSLYTVSKSTGFNLNSNIWLALERIRAGTNVYFYVMRKIERHPFASRCLLLKNNYVYIGSFSLLLMSPTTSSSTSTTLTRVLHFSSSVNSATNFSSISSTSEYLPYSTCSAYLNCRYFS